VIDLHCHALAGIDDGPETIEDSLALVRVAAATGTRTILATPHVSRLYPNRAATIAGLVDELNERLTSEGIAVEVRPGAEIALTRLDEIAPDELRRLGLAGGPWLLVEPPFTPVATNLDAVLLELQRDGHRIVIAHPERCAAFRRNPDMLRSLVRAGLLTSVTAGSLVGQFGEGARAFALEMARVGLLHNVASDAHDDVRRPPGVAVELRQAGLGSLTEWLTRAVPAAIMNGDERIPPRPPVAIAPAARRERRHRGSLLG
jgi:protein-tyrosine phosphatase